MSTWSTPDPQGVCTLALDVGAKRTLRGKRRKRSFVSPPRPLGHLSEDQRDIIRKWIGGTSARKKWDNLQGSCSFSQPLLAETLLALLVEAGWVETEEHRSPRGWKIVWVEFLCLETLREHLGLVNREKQKEQVARLDGLFAHPLVQKAYASMEGVADAVRLKRHDLLTALDAWVSEERSGTRRDFALAARGDTKGISTAEWDWLEAVLPLEELGVSRHSPLLKLRLPGEIVLPTGRLDGRALSGFVGIQPEDVRRATAISGLPEGVVWRVVENHTTFEKTVELYRDEAIVVWVPGFAPSWWIGAVEHFLRLAPAPLVIGCDPDPAGVSIALQVTKLWERAGLPWGQAGMTPEAVKKAPAKKELKDSDRKTIECLLLRPDAKPFTGFLQWMKEAGIKAEQEGIL